MNFGKGIVLVYSHTGYINYARKFMLKSRIMNKYIIFSFLSIIIISVVSWLLFSGYLSTILFFKASSEWTSKALYISVMFDYQGYIREGFTLLQVLLPVIVSLSIFHFRDEMDGLFPHLYGRSVNYKKTIWLSIIAHLVNAVLVIFSGFLVYMLIGVFLTNTTIDPGNAHDLFSDIFGPNFYLNNQYLFYMTEGTVRYVFFTITYGLFAIAVSLNTEEKYLMVLIPAAYYTVFSILVSMLSRLVPFGIYAFAPNFPLIASSYVNPSTYQVFLGFYPVIIISIYMIMRRLKGDERIGV
jgi:hypothetical protein